MAKIAFSKLDLKIDETIKQIPFTNSKGEILLIEIKSYLPLEQKINLIANVVNQSIDENNFYNPIRLKIFMTLEMIYAYTNLSFSAKQKENIFKLYYQLVSSGIYDLVKMNISEKEVEEIEAYVTTIIENVYQYKNSILGIIDTVSKDYGDVNMDLTEITDKLADPNVLSLIKDIVPLLNSEV